MEPSNGPDHLTSELMHLRGDAPGQHPAEASGPSSVPCDPTSSAGTSNSSKLATVRLTYDILRQHKHLSRLGNIRAQRPTRLKGKARNRKAPHMNRMHTGRNGNPTPLNKAVRLKMRPSKVRSTPALFPTRRTVAYPPTLAHSPTPSRSKLIAFDILTDAAITQSS